MCTKHWRLEKHCQLLALCNDAFQQELMHSSPCFMSINHDFTSKPTYYKI